MTCTSTAMRRAEFRTQPLRGFTLVEILIVVVVIGILAAITVAKYQDLADDTRRTTFVSSGRIFTDAAKRYQLEQGGYLEDGSSGVLPAGFEAYVQASKWGPTPIGGVWDTELNSFGLTSALGVHFNGTGTTRGDAFMAEVDDAIDDGDLATGGFRKLAGDRYYFVLAE